MTPMFSMLIKLHLIRCVKVVYAEKHGGYESHICLLLQEPEQRQEYDSQAPSVHTHAGRDSLSRCHLTSSCGGQGMPRFPSVSVEYICLCPRLSLPVALFVMVMW